MNMQRIQFAAYWVIGLVVAVLGCSGTSSQQQYAIDVEKGTFITLGNTATVIRVTNNEKQPVIIDKLLVNSEYQITKRWDATKPVVCSFPFTIGPDKSEQFFVSGELAKRDPSLALSPRFDSTPFEKKYWQERKKKLEEEMELWKGCEQPLRFVEVVTDRGLRKFNFGGNFQSSPPVR